MADLEPWFRDIEAARKRVYSLAVATPVSKVVLPGRPDISVLIKREDLQNTGSFKVRGATNKVLSLSPELAARGVITSSTGNHGRGVAAAAQHRGVRAEVVVSKQVAAKKLDGIREYGADITLVGDTPLEAELAAREQAWVSGRTYISPYNDGDVIAGQGTIAAELMEQVPRMDRVYVAVGGGGLISGIGAYLKKVSPETEIVGCWPSTSRVMYECLRAGTIIEVPEEPTLSESTAGGVEPGSLTFDLCQSVIDRTVLVAEQDILQAMRWARSFGWQFEGAAGVAVAAAMVDSEALPDKTAVVIACGRNLSPAVEKLL